jgi:hypothetical protein
MVPVLMVPVLTVPVLMVPVLMVLVLPCHYAIYCLNKLPTISLKAPRRLEVPVELFNNMPVPPYHRASMPYIFTEQVAINAV